MQRLTDRAHEICRSYLQPGDVAIDATVGNGHDTFFLAKAVGETGHVYGFDIQASAIESTREKLGEELLSRVTLQEQSHAQMESFLEQADRDRVKGIMFNLGYLPGGEKEITTRTESTLAALKSACELIHLQGLISLIAYPGHEAGREETSAVIDYLESLSATDWHYEVIEAVEGSETAPRLLVLSHQGGS